MIFQIHQEQILLKFLDFWLLIMGFFLPLLVTD
jgi:hypothetical protein